MEHCSEMYMDGNYTYCSVCLMDAMHYCIISKGNNVPYVKDDKLCNVNLIDCIH